MTEWTVEREGARTTFQVVKWKDGLRVLAPTRRSLTGLSCITAQVIAAELNSAYDAGWDAGRKDLADMFMAPLGD